jgi:methylated-DNA-protein-cysteine methyltransferase related protein
MWRWHRNSTRDCSRFWRVIVDRHVLDNRNQRVWRTVAQIPVGRVASYGQIAQLAGLVGRSAARQVGYALAALSGDSAIPWHRVVNAAGKISARSDPDRPDYQRLLLEEEGVEFGLGGVISLERYAWRPDVARG